MKKNNNNIKKSLAVLCATTLLGSTVAGFTVVNANKSESPIKYKLNPTVELAKNKKETETNTSYLGKEKALEIALNNAKVDTNQVRDLEVELENGKYEVSFEVENTDYDYDMDAKSGNILHVEKEEEKGIKKVETKKEETKPATTITKQQALEIAFNHAKVDANQVRDLEVELEKGKYEVSFEVGNTDYEYVIDTKTGNILHVEKEVEKEIKKEETKKEETKPATTITKQQALEIAFNHAKVDANQVRDLEVELEKGKYEVSFEVGNTDYEYVIDSKTGNILHVEKEVEKEIEKEETKKEETKPATTITKQQALEIAFNHAKVDANQVRDLEVELEKGKYEVSFEVANTDYEYVIDSKTGNILHVEKEVEKETKKEETKKEETKPATTITKQQALEIAFNHAKVDANQVRDLEVELEKGKYEVSFEVANTDYEYVIDSKTGNILHVEKEVEKETKKEETKPATTITKQQALEIAFNHAKVDANQVRDLEVELEKGKYEVSFEVGNTEYEYEIDATTGTIIHVEKEIDD